MPKTIPLQTYSEKHAPLLNIREREAAHHMEAEINAAQAHLGGQQGGQITEAKQAVAGKPESQSIGAVEDSNREYVQRTLYIPANDNGQGLLPVKTEQTVAVEGTEAVKPNKLTQADFDKLKEFRDKGDRYSYWNYLGTKFNDAYAKVALSVVTNESLAGHTANYFMMAEAEKRGVKIDSAESWAIGTELMNADYKARKDAFDHDATDGGLKLPISTISKYHRDVFRHHQLGDDNEAWTAGLLVDPWLKMGNNAKAQDNWDFLLRNGGAVDGVLMHISLPYDPSQRRAEWIWRADSAFVSYPMSESNRNINYIRGMNYNGQWYTVFPSELGMHQNLYVDPNSPEALSRDAERQFRIEHFGKNVVR